MERDDHHRTSGRWARVPVAAREGKAHLMNEEEMAVPIPQGGQSRKTRLEDTCDDGSWVFRSRHQEKGLCNDAVAW